jgi:PST family polysaccharide transporter
LSKFSHQPERQRDLAMEASEILAYLIMPVGWMIAALAPALFPLVFGHKWDAAIPLTQILSIALAFDAIAWVAGALLNTRGEFKRAFQTAFLLAPIFFVAVATGALADSAYGAAWGVMVYYIINGPVYYYVTFRRLGISVGKILSVCFVPAILCAISIGIPSLLIPHAGLPPLVTAAAIGVLGGATYLLVLAMTARDVFTRIVKRIKGAIVK